MPTLDWIGRKAVENHHLQVPYHLLRDVPERSCGDPGSGNLIVEGDNLLALKALLPYYAGQVKCIYIDPPYNTGNEGWVYPDFICLLQDDRVLVVEYKGGNSDEAWYSMSESLEKRAVGALWESRSEGRCLFIMPQGKDWDAIENKLG